MVLPTVVRRTVWRHLFVVARPKAKMPPSGPLGVVILPLAIVMTLPVVMVATVVMPPLIAIMVLPMVVAMIIIMVFIGTTVRRSMMFMVRSVVSMSPMWRDDRDLRIYVTGDSPKY